ncbi:hypothetical protein LPJ59_001391 [Coemansia sp. RSA 2399]|nr:hypothetical protein LPJ59_001391 [Coemansia sp. RSA 2399]KAJ1906640.1 hypothetical protein LPJ81_001239 [Coemansia sp. IMI 209127]
MLRSLQSRLQTLQGIASARAIHTTSITSSKRRLSNRKAELEAQRVAEAEARERAKEQLKKLKDTEFLNSLVHPNRLFQSTQVSQQDAAISSSLAFQSKGSAGDSGQSFEAGLRRKADSGAYAYHIDPRDMDLICEVAPKAASGVDTGFGHSIMPEAINKNGETQADIVRRIAALDNANAKAVSKYNVRKAIAKFGRSDGDSGSAEVQAAVWTIRINSLEDHLRSNNKDHQNRRKYTLLLHKRAKMLKYLKRECLERYYLCLNQLGLTKAMVEGEILIPKRIE